MSAPSISLHRLTTTQPSGTLRATLWTLLALVAVLLAWTLTARSTSSRSPPASSCPPRR